MYPWNLWMMSWRLLIPFIGTSELVFHSLLDEAWMVLVLHCVFAPCGPIFKESLSAQRQCTLSVHKAFQSLTTLDLGEDR